MEEPLMEEPLSVTALAIDPKTPGALYAGAGGPTNGWFWIDGETERPEGGIYKSTNGAESWQEANNGFPAFSTAVECLAINPLNSNILYAGTSPAKSWNKATKRIEEIFPGKGVFRSADRAESWEEMNAGLTDLNIWSIAIDPKNPRRVYAGTSNGVFVIAQTGDFPWASVELEEKQIITLGKVKRNALLQNYPNPFNPETWIPYLLAEPAEVTIQIYNVTGQVVRTLHIGRQDSGEYVSKGRAAHWDGRNNAGERVASGVYFYQIQAGNFTAMRRLAICK